MSDRLDRWGRGAAHAVRARTAGLDPEEGLGRVVRRGRRPRSSAVVLAVLALLLAVPAVGWLRSLTGPTIGFVDEPPAPAPATQEPSPEATSEPQATASPQPASSPTAAPTAPPTQAATAEPSPQAGPTALGTFATEAVASEDLEATLPEAVPGVAREGARLAGDPAAVALLSDVRVAGHDGFDRVVLEFEGGASAYVVRYVDPPILSDGAGEEVDVAGNAFLEVRLFSASGVDLADTGDQGYRLTYSGPARVTGSTTTVTEAVRTGDFEATLSWVLGLDQRAPFAVAVLHDPLRLVIDVQTP